MKKSLVLAMAMALGVTASAYAANPFSDVPAGHWAYDSIDQLVAAGVVEGMPNGNFEGGRNMTRYEMAQIVAKAMAKGAKVEKLVAEFAEELDKLGVRVAALEKKADNVTITGQIRADFARQKKGQVKSDNKNLLRTRLFLNGQINEDWAYHARIQNDQKWGDGAPNNNVELNQAYVTGKLGGVAVTAGRMPFAFADGIVYDGTIEGGQASYGKTVKFSVFGGREVEDMHDANVAGVVVAAKIGSVDAKLGYMHEQGGNYTAKVDPDDDTKLIDTSVGQRIDNKKHDDNNIIALNINAPVAKDLVGSAAYLHSDCDARVEGASKNGYQIGLAYKGASAAKPGSWGLSAKYMNIGANIAITSTEKAAGQIGAYVTEGFKGYTVGGNVTLAKNMVYSLDYYDLKGKETSVKTKVLYSRLQMTF